MPWGGDGKKKERKRLIESILSLKPRDEGAFDPTPGLYFSIIYFFDANSKGVEARLKEIETEVEDVFDIKDFDLSNGGPLKTINDYRVGCYIFAGDNNKGTLEDIMLPLMEKNNEKIFEKASEFLELKKDDDDDERLRKLKLIFNKDGSIEERRSSEKMIFDQNKSKICIAGQLQNSGKSNAVIIRDCDFINLKKINECGKCRKIMEFIEYL